MRQYYRNKETTDERIVASHISNGIILGNFCEESGHQWGGHQANKLFVTKEELEKEWVPFNFAVTSTSNETAQKAVVKMFTKMMNEFHQYGILEDYTDEMYSIAREGDAIELALFSDSKDHQSFMDKVRTNIRNNVPEDYADELLHSEGETFFNFLFYIKDPINEMINTLTKANQ